MVALGAPLAALDGGILASIHPVVTAACGQIYCGLGFAASHAATPVALASGQVDGGDLSGGDLSGSGLTASHVGLPVATAGTTGQSGKICIGGE